MFRPHLHRLSHNRDNLRIVLYRSSFQPQQLKAVPPPENICVPHKDIAVTDANAMLVSLFANFIFTKPPIIFDKHILSYFNKIVKIL